jgi:hypothetical protein
MSLVNVVVSIWSATFSSIPSQPVTGPFVDPQQDRVAVESLDRFNPASKTLNVEFAGAICKGGDGGYFASAPAISAVPDKVIPSACPAGSQAVAQFHTHGSFGQVGPTSADLERAGRPPQLAQYLATPCDSILRWQGNDASRMITLRPCRR